MIPSISVRVEGKAGKPGTGEIAVKGKMTSAAKTGSRKLMFFWLLLAGVLLLLPLSAEKTVSSRVALRFTAPGGIRLLDLTGISVNLHGYGLPVYPEAGARSSAAAAAVSRTGSRLHYTLHGASGPYQLVVSVDGPVAPGVLLVEVLDFLPGYPGRSGSGIPGTAVSGEVAVGPVPRKLIGGIGDCFTGEGADDGPLLRYTLAGDPGTLTETLAVRFALVPE